MEMKKKQMEMDQLTESTFQVVKGDISILNININCTIANIQFLKQN